MKDRIEFILKEKVNPVLEQHFGGARLVDYQDGTALVKLTGACSSCPSAQSTIEDVVKSILQSELPEIQDVVLDTSVSEDLLELARKILKKD